MGPCQLYFVFFIRMQIPVVDGEGSFFLGGGGHKHHLHSHSSISAVGNLIERSAGLGAFAGSNQGFKVGGLYYFEFVWRGGGGVEGTWH